MSEADDYNELCAYTLTHNGRDFIHQHVVDAWKAQKASDASKPIGVVFSLAGLYLHVEMGFTGRQVQQAHMQMSKSAVQWPWLPLPVSRGAMTASDVMRSAEGEEREKAIHDWTVSVWGAFSGHRETVVEILQRTGALRP